MWPLFVPNTKAHPPPWPGLRFVRNETPLPINACELTQERGACVLKITMNPRSCTSQGAGEGRGSPLWAVSTTQVGARTICVAALLGPLGAMTQRPAADFDGVEENASRLQVFGAREGAQQVPPLPPPSCARQRRAVCMFSTEGPLSRAHSALTVADLHAARQRPTTGRDLQFRWVLRVAETVSGEDDRECPGKPRTARVRLNTRS